MSMAVHLYMLGQKLNMCEPRPCHCYDEYTRASTMLRSKANKSVPSTPTLLCMAERSGYVVMTVMMMTALMIGTP